MLKVLIFLSIISSVLCNNDDGENMGSYIGTYLAVLVIALPFISHVLDCFGVANGIVYRLGDKAHYNFMKQLLVTREIDKHKHEDATFNQGEYAPNEAVVTSEEAAQIKKRATVHIESEKDCCGNEKRCCGQKTQVHEYDPNFTLSLLNQRTYYDTYNDVKTDSCCCQPSSLYSDCLFYFLNNHSIVGMFAALKGHPFSRYERRMAFIVRHGLAFLICIAFSQLSLSTPLKVVLNTLVVTPLMAFVNQSYYILMACPCLQGEHTSCLTNCFKCVEGGSFFFAHFCCLISIIWVIVAGVITYDNDHYATLGKYVYQVLAFGLGLEVILLYLSFFSSTFCVEFKLFGYVFYTISDWFSEKCKYEDLERQKTHCCIIPCILSFTISRATGKSLQHIDIDDIEEGAAKPVEAVDVHVVQASPATEKAADVAPPAPTVTTADVAPPAPTTTAADVAPPMP